MGFASIGLKTVALETLNNVCPMCERANDVLEAGIDASIDVAADKFDSLSVGRLVEIVLERALVLTTVVTDVEVDDSELFRGKEV